MELGWGRGRDSCCRGGVAAAGEVPAGPAGRGMMGRPPPVGGSKVGGVAGADGPGVVVEGIDVAGTAPMRGRVARDGGGCWEAGSWLEAGDVNSQKRLWLCQMTLEGCWSWGGQPKLIRASKRILPYCLHNNLSRLYKSANCFLAPKLI